MNDGGPGSVNSRRMALAAAALALLAALAAQVHMPALVRAPLGYLLMGVIPGWLLADSMLRAGSTTAEELAMASLTLSIPLTIAGRVLAFACGLSAPAFVWAWATLCAIGALLLRPRPRALPPADRVVWGIAATLALLVALPAALDVVIRTYGDAMSHVQMVNEIRLRGIPPQDPANAGMPMTYPWQFHVWATALVEGMGITPFGIFQWVGGAMMATMVFGVFRVASLFWTEAIHRRLAPVVVALGMNALGWALMAAHLMASFVRGRSGSVQQMLSEWLLHPNANLVCGALIYNSYFVLCSMLFKFMVASTIGIGLALTVAIFVQVAARLREDGRGGLLVIAMLSLTSALIHPMVGVPADLALLAGLALAALHPEGRGRAILSALAVAAGLAVAIPVVAYMLHLGSGGVGANHWIQLNRTNLLPLAQGLAVVALPAVWGWVVVARRSPALAMLGLGFALASLALSLFLHPPVARTEAYTVYGAYLSVALFAAAGVGAFVSAVSRRFGKPVAWALAGLVFLPNALLMFNGFSRQDAAWGMAGYPETRDEIAVFDFVRDHTSLDAVVIDLQAISSSSVAAYSGRRSYFGGNIPGVAQQAGHSGAELDARERIVANVLLEPGLRDSTLDVLRSLRAPLYVVARATPPLNRNVRSLPSPPIDPIAKLDALPESFLAVLRTPTLALFRFRPGPATTEPPPAGAADGSLRTHPR